ncbi:hypothetical protein LEP1GSC008_1085 [Leptospira kirschneri serovar Bulgarica str. Nikolaevo]|uniref:Uncharacterized protein n=1 Tax=Leptospira kirschneri serovar Bulgarica str. Nikolaevo TaxID=1240687 RepID=M6FRY3_9LEPT|nr:hypothetical protein LEP1GSC008_1085 [Leptospira kirschneri serovar Bulgarica str. Nikolaevo]
MILKNTIFQLYSLVMFRNLIYEHNFILKYQTNRVSENRTND